MQARLAKILNSRVNKVFVAEQPGGQLAGWIHGFLSQSLESDGRVEIGGLIVDQQWQRRGIGGRLVQAVETWAVDQGVVELSVRCRTERTEAHTFYSNLSFQHAKTQHVFRKSITGPAR
jgi:GNAT superfamily N-acetyltransferase